MCGIFGAAGKYGVNDFKMLAVLNETRGTDSCGFYNGDKVIRTLVKPRDLMAKVDILNVRTEPFIIGHTRKATVGDVKVKNAHPFTEGNIIGVHNGSVSNYKEICDHYKIKKEVDSQVIFWGLNEFGIDWLEEINSQYSLAWIDKLKPGKLFLACNSKPLGVALAERCVWFSSEKDDLKRIGCEKPDEIFSDSVLEIDTSTLSITRSKKGPVHAKYSKYKKKEIEPPSYSPEARGYGRGIFKKDNEKPETAKDAATQLIYLPGLDSRNLC